MTPLILATAVIALFAINLWTYIRFWQDKVRAQDGNRRIPERDLLTLAFIGGSLGALIARQVFRHKTRKQPFSDRLVMIATFQAAIVVGLAAAAI